MSAFSQLPSFTLVLKYEAVKNHGYTSCAAENNSFARRVWASPKLQQLHLLLTSAASPMTQIHHLTTYLCRDIKLTQTPEIQAFLKELPREKGERRRVRETFCRVSFNKLT